MPLVPLLCAALLAQNCDNTSTGRLPLTDLGSGLYLGLFEGGLYPGGQNLPPAAHALEGVARADGLRPLDPLGAPDVNGRIGLVSIGMSTTTQEFCSSSSFPPCGATSFMAQAAGDPRVDSRVVFVNGAFSEQVTETWESPAHPNYDRIRDLWLSTLGMSELQVQVAWVKLTNAFPQTPLPAPNADAVGMTFALANVVRALKARYPNLQLVFLSSRHYGGYVVGNANPEPYAYETGFAVKWLIEAQILQASGSMSHPDYGDLNYAGATPSAPWIAWGPYLWADGLTPRGDGLTWTCADYEPDGLHPSPTGEGKVAEALFDFLLHSPFSAPWFTNGRDDAHDRSPIRLR